MIIRRFYGWIAKKADNKWIELYADIIPWLAASYLLFKKFYNFSISGWLASYAFKQPLVTFLVSAAIFLLVSALLTKLILIFIAKFPPSEQRLVEPAGISAALQKMNSEISEHLTRINGSKCFDIGLIKEQHHFMPNMASIIDALAEHIRSSIKDIKVKNKDIFISLYSNNENKELVYLLHYDPKRDLVGSKVIKIGVKKFAKYECVKCMLSFEVTAYVLNKKHYEKGATRRTNSVQQYMGCKLLVGSKVFGFLNIEFHNQPIFTDEDKMIDFMEKHVYPFKLLLEYQFLKRDFFSLLNDASQQERLK